MWNRGFSPVFATWILQVVGFKKAYKGGKGVTGNQAPPMAMPLSHNCNIFIFIHTWVAKLQVFILLGQGLKPVEVQLHPDSALVPFPPSTESGK